MARTPRTKKPKLDALDGVSDPRAPLDSAALLAAAKPLLAKLEVDLRARAAASPSVTRALEERHAVERKAERTADSFSAWSNALATQVAAAWLLSCVFVRTLEDRGLLRHARLAGPGALDSQRLFFQLAPSLNERDYLLTVFRELATHPAAADLFDADHSLVWKLSPSAELAKELLALFRTPNADAPAFRFGQASTRFLGDLYQDVSEDVRKRYALLQTPDFVESFILDRTLEPAIERFGLDDTTVIDPTCGSGHFLLGSFDRLFDHRLRAEPGLDRRVAATRALDAVFGADINPYAVAIARFRLTLSFLEKAGYAKLADAPTLPLHLVVADSLLHNPQHQQTELAHVAGQSASAWGGDQFALEDEAAARDVLFRQYAAVVGNPPYITEKDSAKREVYRRTYVSAAMQFSLSAPFCERFFQLARARGCVGQITANSFMKREFGKKLIEEYLPTINLELIVNSSGAYLPGHGTPTVLLFGTTEVPSERNVLAVLAKRGEPSTPEEPAKGLVWTSIVDHWCDVGFENDFVSIARVERIGLSKHPWSLGGGGTLELKELLEERASRTLQQVVSVIGFSVITGEDNCLVGSYEALRRAGVDDRHLRRLVLGEEIRDWAIGPGDHTLWPNRNTGERLEAAAIPDVLQHLWPFRTVLKDRKAFGTRVEEKGIPWWALREVYTERMQTPRTITFAFVATHNHFVLDRGGKVFKQSAPIIKLPANATEEDHLALLAYLNSSTACFWMKQVFMNKGGSGIGRGIQDEAWEARFEFDGTKLQQLPIFGDATLTALGARAAAAAHAWGERGAHAVLSRWPTEGASLIDRMNAEADAAHALFRELVALQEQIDWHVYRIAELCKSTPPAQAAAMLPGQRAFEHRLMVDNPGTQWFARNAYETPGPRDRAPEGTRERLAMIDASPELGLIETPEYKRRWTVRERASEIRDAAQSWLLDLAERLLDGAIPVSTRDLIGRTLAAPGARDVAGLLAKESSTDAVAELTKLASVPFLAAERFTEEGLVKFAAWCATWELQRAEDRGEKVGAIPVPPRYDRTDFQGDAWALRGKLDAPKERFISYPGCQSDEDGEPVYGWAGWNHLQRAQALASLYLKRKDGEGWAKERLTPMLAGLLELIPWIKQWHNEPSAEFDGLRMGDYFEQFLDAECRQHGLSHDDLRAWRPTKRSARKPRPATIGKAASAKPGKSRKPQTKSGDEPEAA